MLDEHLKTHSEQDERELKVHIVTNNIDSLHSVPFLKFFRLQKIIWHGKAFAAFVANDTETIPDFTNICEVIRGNDVSFFYFLIDLSFTK